MKLMPFSSLSQTDQRIVLRYIEVDQWFIPGCYFAVSMSCVYQHVKSIKEWAAISHVPIFVSILMNIIVFENENDAALFKLTWINAWDESK